MNYLIYERQPGDAKYRIVSLKSLNIGQFTPFEKDTISYTAKITVLEVMDEAGNTRIVYGEEPDQITVRRTADQITLAQRVPTERLWVRPRNGGISYKVPSKLKAEDNQIAMLIPAGAGKVELYGDEYFNAAYVLL